MKKQWVRIEFDGQVPIEGEPTTPARFKGKLNNVICRNDNEKIL
jgi:hypothetical protein